MVPRSPHPSNNSNKRTTESPDSNSTFLRFHRLRLFISTLFARNHMTRKTRRSFVRMQHVLRIIHAALVMGAVATMMLVSTWMESGTRELQLLTNNASMLRTYTTPQQLSSIQMVPRVVHVSPESWSNNNAGSSEATTPGIMSSLLRRLPVPSSTIKATSSHVFPLKPRRTAPTVALEDDPTRFYPDESSNDLPNMEVRRYPRHETDPNCEPIDPSWQSTFHPICNDMHASSMMDNLKEESLTLLSAKGFWRLAWKQQDNYNKHDVHRNKTTVWKTFKIQHNYEEAFYENNRVDAVAMERLTASRNIIDIYAYCGTSVVTEFAGKELADNINRLNSMERLDMAIQVAQGVADVHGITPDRPSLVHNDLNLANLVLTQDNRPVLNDFNIAILLMKHNETGETCPFLSHFPNPQWRAPEEQVFSEEESSNHPPLVTEKIDIYGLGNVFYRLAVGFSPWKKPNSKQIAPEQKDLIAKLKKTKGAVPLVPQCVTEYDDPIVQVLLEAMRQAYRFDPKSRPSAAELVSFLKQSQTEIRAMNMKGRKPLWDGSPPRKTSSSTGDQQQWFDSTIGNADCGKPKEEEHDELLVF